MALQTSGAISLNDIHIEAGGSSGTSATINDTDIRNLISKGSGIQMGFSEWYGASSGPVYLSEYSASTSPNAGTIFVEGAASASNTDAYWFPDTQDTFGGYVGSNNIDSTTTVSSELGWRDGGRIGSSLPVGGIGGRFTATDSGYSSYVFNRTFAVNPSSNSCFLALIIFYQPYSWASGSKSTNPPAMPSGEFTNLSTSWFTSIEFEVIFSGGLQRAITLTGSQLTGANGPPNYSTSASDAFGQFLDWTYEGTSTDFFNKSGGWTGNSVTSVADNETFKLGFKIT